MKKTIFTFLSLLPLLAFSQSFKLTPQGFTNAIDTTKSYIVVDVPNKTQTELYKSALIYFTSTYVSPKDVISKVENETLSINGFAEGIVHENKMATPFNVNYTVVFSFKDGKIKVDKPNFNLTVGLRTKYLVYTGLSMNGEESGLYGKGGKVKSERAIEDLEKFFDNLVSKFKEGLAKKSDW